MKKLWKSSEQRGTLLVEAIAMLALIAMVTPTLYRKSAERLQEIQDINIASQMRTLNTAINSFVKSNSGSMAQFAKDNWTGNTFKICYENQSTAIEKDSSCYQTGYSSMIPFGYNPMEVKHFLAPEIYAYGNDGVLQYYIIYGKEAEIGKKRATRLASLVGSNGGVINKSGLSGSSSYVVNGTGNAWSLSAEDMTDKIKFDTDVLSEDSLMITSTEPIIVDQDENDVYLYRIPPAGEGNVLTGDYYKNTMITDLYMGGYSEDMPSNYRDWGKDYFSIFNVRKLTLNTRCRNDALTHGSEVSSCVPVDVADLYVGKPVDTFLLRPGQVMSEDGQTRYYNPNKGAAWIYGNLSALNDNFRVFRGGLTGSEDAETVVKRATGYDVMQFARLVPNDPETDRSFLGYDDSSVTLQVFRATNEADSARVSMMDGLVNVVEKFNNYEITPDAEIKAFTVGQDSSVGGEGSLITAYHNMGRNLLYLNSGHYSSTTHINQYGGNVYINAEDESSAVNANTYINRGGGTIEAGIEGEWLRARGEHGSAEVHLLNPDASSLVADNRIFTVGNSDVGDEKNMIYADSSKVALRNKRFLVYNKDMNDYWSSAVGGKTMLDELGDPVPASTNDLYNGATVVATQTLDVLGQTYLGVKAMRSDPETADDGAKYTRGNWVAGIAGSAWVDETLWARRGWLKKGGMSELHAGFSSFEEFDTAPENAWLNVYDSYDDVRDGVVIRNKNAIAGSGSTWTNDDVLFIANEQGVEIKGNANDAASGSTVTFGEWRDSFVRVGAAARTGEEELVNAFVADVNAANVLGSSLVNVYTLDGSTDGVVNVQDGAMQFRGGVGSSGVYGNEILTQARWFGVTANSSFVEEGNVQFRVGSSDAMANASEVRVRNADFAVRDSSGVGKLWVRPDEDVVNSSLANVNIDGSLYVTGNEIVHIASNIHNTAEKDSQRAMFEIDPNYVQVWAKTEGGSSFAGSSATDYYAMLRINPYDTSGQESVAAHTKDASIYVRKGAIELMQSVPEDGSSGVGASEGFGYIKANRLVSNTGIKVANVANTPDNRADGVLYDEYMVNPAYTSVMHDIKLTTRGGGRLSDILPDYVLKGVYNISNDFLEGSDNERIRWSCGDQCDRAGSPYVSVSDNVRWADAYVGKIPFAMCPPGYVNLATIMPISFMMGQAGEIMKKSTGVGADWGTTKGMYYVNFGPAQANILNAANGSTEVGYPGYHPVRSVSMEALNVDSAWSGTGAPTEYLKNITTKMEGWFMGVPYEGDVLESLEAYNNLMTGDKTISNVGVWKYKEMNSAGVQGTYMMAQPLYFQQNTWLKTSVDPKDKHWNAYMGFIYDKTVWNELYAGQSKEGLVSNNTTGSSTVPFQGYGSPGDFVWNLFPVPTNSIEGHATVYCYFDRKQFENYQDNAGNPLVDQIDQMDGNAFRTPGGNKMPTSDTDGRVQKYLDRLEDPSLKYKNPW